MLMASAICGALRRFSSAIIVSELMMGFELNVRSRRLSAYSATASSRARLHPCSPTSLPESLHRRTPSIVPAHALTHSRQRLSVRKKDTKNGQFPSNKPSFSRD